MNFSARTARLRQGDLVEVRSPDEILKTLDTEGAVDRLPFMPEMAGFCGKRFKVSQKMLKTCCFGARSTMRSFRQNDVVLLDGLRCSGTGHDGCQKACNIFWREAWLRKVDAFSVSPASDPVGNHRLLSRLKTSSSVTTYFCQASELLKATNHLSRLGRLKVCLNDVRVGNCSAIQMVQRVGIWLFWRIRRVFLGPYARGVNKSTPVENLALKSGELVEVKSIQCITETLDAAARNRGLFFSPNMSFLCEKEKRVINRIDKIIVDGTGEMRQMRNTVFLDGSHCGCPYVALGGCSRGEYAYWREIWLRRAA